MDKKCALSASGMSVGGKRVIGFDWSRMRKGMMMASGGGFTRQPVNLA